MDLADEDAGRPADWVGRCAEVVVEPAESRDQLGGGGDHAGLVRGTHDLVDRRSLAANGGLPGRRAPAGDRQHVAERLGEQHGVAAVAVADELIELAAVAPGGFVQVVGRQQDRAGRQHPASRSARTASTAAAIPAFMSDAPLPVIRPSWISGGMNGKCTVSRWPSNWRVGPGRPLSSRIETAGAVGWPASSRWTSEPVGCEQLRESVAHRPGIAGWARHFDQPSRRLDQPLAVHVRFKAFDDRG